MGQFSWKFCDRPRKALRIGERGFLLLPPNLAVRENNYSGYGVFSEHDVFVMAAILNREYLSQHPEYPVWKARFIEVTDGRGGTKKKHLPAVKISEYPWYPLYADITIPPERFDELVSGMDYRGFPMDFRSVGIEIAATDDQNRRLPYPIKIATKVTLYESWPASKVDPRQGR